MDDLFDTIDYFEGTLEDALVHNTLLDGAYVLPGVPVAITCDAAKSGVGMDLTQARHEDGRIGNKAIVFLGDQDAGKTFAANVCLYNWCGIDAGPFTGSLTIDSWKLNNADKPETYPLITDLLECDVIEAAKLKINGLSPLWDLTLSEASDMVVRQVQVEIGSKLNSMARNAIKDCMKKIHGTSQSTYPRLAELLREYRPTPGIYKQDWQVQQKKQAAFEVSETIEVLSDVFKGGDDEVVLRLLSQRAKSWSFKNVTPSVRSQIEIFRGAIEMSALTLNDPDDPKSGRKHPERVAQYIVRDEAGFDWSNPEVAESEFLRIKTLRENDTYLVTIMQRLADFLTSAGSAKARNMLREVSVWFVGRQSLADIPDIIEMLNPPKHVLATLTTLPKGHFWLFLPGRAPRLVFFVGMDLEIETFVTNQANQALLERYLATGDFQFYMQWLEETSPPVKEEDLHQPTTEQEYASDAEHVEV